MGDLAEAIYADSSRSRLSLNAGVVDLQLCEDAVDALDARMLMPSTMSCSTGRPARTCSNSADSCQGTVLGPGAEPVVTSQAEGGDDCGQRHHRLPGDPGDSGGDCGSAGGSFGMTTPGTGWAGGDSGNGPGSGSMRRPPSSLAPRRKSTLAQLTRTVCGPESKVPSSGIQSLRS